MNVRRTSRLATAAIGLAILSQAALGDEIFNTGLPGGWFGYIGYDVFESQSVAVAFTPTQDYKLDDIGVWIMSNDWDNPGRTYTLSLRADASISSLTEPAATSIESWNVATSAVGWNPVLETATSALHPTLSANKTYWVVAESSEPGGVDPVWVWGDSPDEHYTGIIDFFSSPNWQVGAGFGNAPGTVINATPVPEPVTLSLLGTCVAAIASRRKRR